MNDRFVFDNGQELDSKRSLIPTKLVWILIHEYIAQFIVSSIL